MADDGSIAAAFFLLFLACVATGITLAWRSRAKAFERMVLQLRDLGFVQDGTTRRDWNAYREWRIARGTWKGRTVALHLYDFNPSFFQRFMVHTEVVGPGPGRSRAYYPKVSAPRDGDATLDDETRSEMLQWDAHELVVRDDGVVIARRTGWDDATRIAHDLDCAVRVAQRLGR